MASNQHLKEYMASVNINECKVFQTGFFERGKIMAWINKNLELVDNTLLACLQGIQLQFDRTYLFAQHWNRDFLQCCFLAPKGVRCFSVFSVQRLLAIQTSQYESVTYKQKILVVIDMRDFIPQHFQKVLCEHLIFSRHYNITYFLISSTVKLPKMIKAFCDFLIFDSDTKLPKLTDICDTATNLPVFTDAKWFVVISYRNHQQIQYLPVSKPVTNTTRLSSVYFVPPVSLDEQDACLAAKNTTILTYDQIISRHTSGIACDADDQQANIWIRIWTIMHALQIRLVNKQLTRQLFIFHVVKLFFFFRGFGTKRTFLQQQQIVVEQTKKNQDVYSTAKFFVLFWFCALFNVKNVIHMEFQTHTLKTLQLFRFDLI